MADKYQGHAEPTTAGGVLTGLGLLQSAGGARPALVLLEIDMLSQGQSMSISAQQVRVARATGKLTPSAPANCGHRLPC